MVLVPTLGEGFGLPALEAQALQSAVVTAPLEHLPNAQNDGVYRCNPESVEDIHRALEEAFRATAGSKRPEIPEWNSSLRSMEDTVQESFSVYQQVLLRYNAASQKMAR